MTDYHYQDLRNIRSRIVDDHQDVTARQPHLDQLSRVVQYCQNITDCRRTQVLAFFDETFPPEQCNKLCDNCQDLSPVQEVDMTPHAHNFIRLLQEVQKTKRSITRSTLIQCVLGKSNATVKNNQFNTLATFGASQGLALSRAERLFDELLITGLVEPYMSYGGGRGKDKFPNEYVEVRVELTVSCSVANSDNKS